LEKLAMKGSTLKWPITWAWLRQRDRETEKQTVSERQRDRQCQRDRDADGVRETERQTVSERQKDRQEIETQEERDKETKRQIERRRYAFAAPR
jgi:hypothetical protein